MKNITLAALVAAAKNQGYSIEDAPQPATTAASFLRNQKIAPRGKVVSALNNDKSDQPARTYSTVGRPDDVSTSSGWPAFSYQCRESGRFYKVPADLVAHIKTSK